ncbi:ABC transporter permease subunit [Thermoproteus tenax]|uniref:ABC-type anion transport system, duplicated permease component n=1 Tax=Thermoproteus tenax (strain ATCC 35583 / DSM 2078 / JCM 9277 / NBRC 100435 / Kra 1) TaxID=768679 RepID=G4RLZ3_THETK|nr:ABC transporter permease subunit [Thermoproteus tenax]CCC82588.1 ABC-type anion transport system, duplicated permease component [Thermoproteus tenax Kra 1]
MNVYLTLVLATLATTARVFALIGASIVTGWLLGYLAIKSRVFENLYTSLIGVFESVPVFSFFPVVLVLFVSGIGGYLGVELAADFLVFTAVVWNIWIGIYQAFKTVPREMLEVAENLRFGFLKKMRYLYIPYSIPRIAANLLPSFADAYFYITVSEVFSVGSSTYQVFGIGSAIAQLAASGAPLSLYLLALAILSIAVSLSVYAIREFADYAAAKYAVDTSVPIRRRRFIPPRAAGAFGGSLARIARNIATTYRQMARQRRPPPERERNYDKLLRPIGIVVGVVLLSLILYGAIEVIKSTPWRTWESLFARTPSVIPAILADYARVFIIALLSTALAVTLGYYLVTHPSIERVMVPVIQTFAAYPAPVYFPIIFAATYAALYGALGYYANEVYVIALGFISTFYYVFYSFWMGLKAVPHEVWELMENLDMPYTKKMAKILLPGTLPYLISGLSSTINSAWGGLAIGEYWPDIIRGETLQVKTGLMKLITYSTAQGDVALAAWASLLFAVIVVLFSIFFTRRMMDLAMKKYIMEEAVFAA